MQVKQYRGIEIRNRSRGRNDWFISHGGRVRWGTLDEIKEDADYLIQYGHLPPRGSGPGGVSARRLQEEAEKHFRETGRYPNPQNKGEDMAKKRDSTVSHIESRTGYTPYGEYEYDVYDVDGDEVEVHGIPAGIYFEEEVDDPDELVVDVIWEGALDFSGEFGDAIARYPELAGVGAFG